MPNPISQDDLSIFMAEADAMARRLRHRHGLAPEDVDDLRQELLVALIARFPAYDPARGTVGAFANVVLRHEASRIGARIARHRKLHGAKPVSLDEPVPDAEGVTLGDIVSEAEGLSAWHGQPTDALAKVERRIDIEKALGALARRDATLAAKLSALSVDEIVAAGGGARRTLYRRLDGVRIQLAAHGLGPAWHGFRAA
jgi:RNA polymerase sigma-70 factor (ECF subfamily)